MHFWHWGYGVNRHSRIEVGLPQLLASQHPIPRILITHNKHTHPPPTRIPNHLPKPIPALFFHPPLTLPRPPSPHSRKRPHSLNRITKIIHPPRQTSRRNRHIGISNRKGCIRQHQLHKHQTSHRRPGTDYVQLPCLDRREWDVGEEDRGESSKDIAERDDGREDFFSKEKGGEGREDDCWWSGFDG